MKSPIGRAAVCLALAAAYFLAGKAGLQLAVVNRSATAVWAPSGISIAVLLLFGDRWWPGVFLGAFLTNLTTAGGLVTWTGIAIGNTAEALLGAWLVRRFSNGVETFRTPRGIFKFTLLAGGLSTTASASMGVASLALTGYAAPGSLGSVWLTWWLGDAMGVLLVAPLIVLGRVQRHAHWTPAKTAEAAGMFACLLLASLVVFGGWLPAEIRGYPLAFFCLPLLLWCAFRLGRFETAIFALVHALIAIWGTLKGVGAFATSSLNSSLLLVQAYMGVISITMLAVAARVEEHRQAEARLREQGDLLAVRNNDLEQFAYAASHDLQEPLRTISLFAQLLVKSAGTVDQKSAHLAARIVGGVARMSSLLEALRNYSAVALPAEIPPDWVDMNEVVELARYNLESAIGESGASVASDKLPVVLGHREQLVALLQNLISNAIKYKGDDPPVIHVEGRRARSEWIFTVTDNGIGVKPEYRSHIFEPFKRLHTSQISGAGMGLAISRRIVELHAGQMWVEPGAPSGSRFCFTIRANPQSKAPGES